MNAAGRNRPVDQMLVRLEYDMEACDASVLLFAASMEAHRPRLFRRNQMMPRELEPPYQNANRTLGIVNNIPSMLRLRQLLITNRYGNFSRYVRSLIEWILVDNQRFFLRGGTDYEWKHLMPVLGNHPDGRGMTNFFSVRSDVHGSRPMAGEPIAGFFVGGLDEISYILENGFPAYARRKHPGEPIVLYSHVTKALHHSRIFRTAWTRTNLGHEIDAVLLCDVEDDANVLINREAGEITITHMLHHGACVVEPCFLLMYAKEPPNNNACAANHFSNLSLLFLVFLWLVQFYICYRFYM